MPAVEWWGQSIKMSGSGLCGIWDQAEVVEMVGYSDRRILREYAGSGSEIVTQLKEPWD